MATTDKLNILHLRFSRSVEDPVAAAATAGTQFSAVQREDYINRAINDISSYIYHAVGMNEARRVLQSMETTQAFTFLTAGVAVASDYVDMPTNLTKNSSTSIFTYYPKKDELDNNVNPNVSAAYTINGNKIYAYESGVILDTPAAGVLSYIRQDAGVTGTIGSGGVEINISPQFYDNVIDLATTLAFEESGEMSSAAARASRVKLLLELIRKM